MTTTTGRSSESFFNKKIVYNIIFFSRRERGRHAACVHRWWFVNGRVIITVSYYYYFFFLHTHIRRWLLLVSVCVCSDLPIYKKMSRRLKAQCVTVRSLLIHARKRSAQRINGQAKIQVCKRKDMRKFLVLDCVCVCVCCVQRWSHCYLPLPARWWPGNEEDVAEEAELRTVHARECFEAPVEQQQEGFFFSFFIFFWDLEQE